MWNLQITWYYKVSETNPNYSYSKELSQFLQNTEVNVTSCLQINYRYQNYNNSQLPSIFWILCYLDILSDDHTEEKKSNCKKSDKKK